MQRHLFFPLLVLLATGCVPKKQFDALEDTLASTRSELDAEKDRAQKLSDQIARLRGDKAELSETVDDMQLALRQLQSRKAEADRRVAEYKSLLEKFKTLIDAGKLRVKIVDGRMVVELPTDVLFPSGSAALSDAGKAAIVEVTGVLQSIPDRAYQVEGFTDNVPIKTTQFPSNWELASARSVTVIRQMIAAGMPPERVSAASYGEYKPMAPNDSAEHKAQNRRIEIVVVPDLSLLPGFDELQKL